MEELDEGVVDPFDEHRQASAEVFGMAVVPVDPGVVTPPLADGGDVLAADQGVVGIDIPISVRSPPDCRSRMICRRPPISWTAGEL